MDINAIKDVVVKAFIPQNNFAYRESKSLKAGLTATIARINFIRIAVSAPIVFALLFTFSKRFFYAPPDPHSPFDSFFPPGQEPFLRFFIHPVYRDLLFRMTSAVLLYTCVVGFIISLVVLFFKLYRCKCTQLFILTYWCIWEVGLSTLLFCPMEFEYENIIFLCFCLIVNLIPLLNAKEFTVEILFIILNMIILKVRLNQLYSAYIAVLIAGFIAQRLEITSWVLNEFVAVTAMIDPLTGILNRRGAVDLCSQYSGKGPFGVMILDVDYFKNYNDTFGHDAGDNCLASVSKAIKDSVSDCTDIIIRHGGEEFVVVKPQSSKEEIMSMAESIRNAVLELKIEAAVKQTCEFVTVSIGCTVAEDIIDGRYEEAVKVADKGLYTSKENGRNQVTFV